MSWDLKTSVSIINYIKHQSSQPLCKKHKNIHREKYAGVMNFFFIPAVCRPNIGDITCYAPPMRDGDRCVTPRSTYVGLGHARHQSVRPPMWLLALNGVTWLIDTHHTQHNTTQTPTHILSNTIQLIKSMAMCHHNLFSIHNIQSNPIQHYI